jgi:hypothetical protein
MRTSSVKAVTQELLSALELDSQLITAGYNLQPSSAVQISGKDHYGFPALSFHVADASRARLHWFAFCVPSNLAINRCEVIQGHSAAKPSNQRSPRNTLTDVFIYSLVV